MMLKIFSTANRLVLSLLCVLILLGCSKQKQYMSSSLPTSGYSSEWSSTEKYYTIFSDDQTLGIIHKHLLPENISITISSSGEIENWGPIIQALGVYDFSKPTAPYALSSSKYADCQFTFGEKDNEKTYYYYFLENYIFEFRFNENDNNQKMSEKLSSYIITSISNY